MDIAVPTSVQGRALFEVRPSTLVAPQVPPAFDLLVAMPTPDVIEVDDLAADLEQTSTDAIAQPLVAAEAVIEMRPEDVQPQALSVALPLPDAPVVVPAVTAGVSMNTAGISTGHAGETRIAGPQMNVAAAPLRASLVPVAQLETQAAMNANASANATVLMDVAQAQELTRGVTVAMPGLKQLLAGQDAAESVTAERGIAQIAGTTSTSATGSLASQFVHAAALNDVSATGSTPVSDASRPALATILGERLQVLIERRSEQATVRLDPPSLGSIEIIVRHEAGALQVQLRATNADVARQLQAIGETLRQDLAQRQQADVSVQVWDGSRDADGRQRQRHEQQPWQQEPGRALGSAAAGHTSAFALDAE